MLTIFTPTYNRAYILPRLYNSLTNQINKEFEWVIVDDGSTDNTEELIEKWIKENKIDIRYFKQENQGKPMAHNLGVQKTKGELFVCVDSDDYLTENAVKIILEKWNKVKNIQNCVGIVGMCIFENKEPVGTIMPENIEYSTLRDLYSKYGYRGDTILVYKTDIIKRHSFPKIEREKFIPETYIYDKIDQKGKLAIISEGIYICEYLEDGYTNNSKKLIKNNPKGYILCAKQRMELSKNLKEQYIACAKYVLGNILAKEKCNSYIAKSPKKLLTILSIPVSYAMYLKKYKRIDRND